MGIKVEIKALETPGLVMWEMIAADARSFAQYMLREDYQSTIAIRYQSAADVQKFIARCLRRRQIAHNRSVFHLSDGLKASGHVIGDGFVVMNRPKIFEIDWGASGPLGQGIWY